jgi:hypothetical protein
MFDETTATQDNSMIHGVVCVAVTHPPAELNKRPERSQFVERCERSRKDLGEEGSGSLTSFEGI